jgi:hypothetical protein
VHYGNHEQLRTQAADAVVKDLSADQKRDLVAQMREEMLKALEGQLEGGRDAGAR